LGDILVVFCLKRKSSAACIPHLRTLSLRADVAMRRGIATSAKNKIKIAQTYFDWSFLQVPPCGE
jgi:hypothetical protein